MEIVIKIFFRTFQFKKMWTSPETKLPVILPWISLYLSEKVILKVAPQSW